MKKIIEKLENLVRKCAFWNGFACAVCLYYMTIIVSPTAHTNIILSCVFLACLPAAYWRLYQRWRIYSRLRDIIIRRQACFTVCQQAAVAVAMQKYGGSFMSAMGKALAHADPLNAQRIRDEWPDEWEKYLNLSKRVDDDAEPRH